MTVLSCQVRRRASITAIIATIFAWTVGRADDGRRIYQTIETPHFRIHYYELGKNDGQELVAQKLAVIAERSQRILAPFLGDGLLHRQKIEVLLTDETDDSNGSATVLPYPQIQIFATSPDDRSELNQYDDWLANLFLHEYTHAVHLGTMSGPCQAIVNGLLGWGLGIAYAPNQSQPRFTIEGLAVFEESERTRGGRLRNAIWDMYLRTQLLEGKLQRLDQFSHMPIQFPYGNSAYLYGSELTQYLARRFGEDSLFRLSKTYGASCIPGAINRALKKVVGFTWPEVYRDFTSTMRVRYETQRTEIEKHGLTRPKRILSGHPGISRPTFSADGKLIRVIDYDGHRRPHIQEVDLVTGEQKSVLSLDAPGGLSQSGSELIFHETTVENTFYAFNELYSFDLATGKKSRLTDGLRASNPDISTDGKRIIFETNHASARGLALFNREHGTVETLIPATNFEQVYTPRFSPDGNTVTMARWTQGRRDIWTIDLQTRELRQITADDATEMEPTFSADGRYLYFVSDQTGVFNLYSYEFSTDKFFQLTNVLTGVFDPVVAPDGRTAVFVGFESNGYTLERVELDRASWREVVRQREAPLAPVQAPSTPNLTPHPYRPYRTLIPWLFLPFVEQSSYGTVLGLELNGADIVSHHAWSLRVGMATSRAEAASASANYAYTRFWPTLRIGAARSLLLRDGLVVDSIARNYDEENWSLAVGIDLPVIRQLILQSTISLSYNFGYSRSLTPLPPPDPNKTNVYPETGVSSGIGAVWSITNVRRFLYSISPEQGRVITLRLGFAPRLLGSRFDSYSVSWSWQEFIPLPWKNVHLRNQVLSLRYIGGAAGGDQPTPRRFALGGYPQQDLIRSLYDFSRPGTATMRGYGYASLLGSQFHAISGEYRFPIAWIEHGLYQTLPLYFRRVHGKVFADYGAVYDGPFDWNKLKLGVGAEVIMEINYAYYAFAALQLGYAYGVHEGGGNQIYFLLNSPF